MFMNRKLLAAITVLVLIIVAIAVITVILP